MKAAKARLRVMNRTLALTWSPSTHSNTLQVSCKCPTCLSHTLKEPRTRKGLIENWRPNSLSPCHHQATTAPTISSSSPCSEHSPAPDCEQTRPSQTSTIKRDKNRKRVKHHQPMHQWLPTSCVQGIMEFRDETKQQQTSSCSPVKRPGP